MGEKIKQDSTTAIFKIDIHCEGCATKLRKFALQIQGVERARADWEANKLTVTGKFDPTKLREKLADKTKKKIDIVSSETVKENKPNQPEPEKKPEENKPKDKGETPVTTATLKVELHCEGCIDKIYKLVSRTKGVEEIGVERQKDLVMVKGKMDVKVLIENLEDKLKRKVAVVVPKKDKDDGPKPAGDGGGKNKSAGDAAVLTEANKLENVAVSVTGYGYGYGYGNGFVGEHLPSVQMFSDENPNACSLM